MNKNKELMMGKDNFFENPFKGKPLSEQTTNPNIIVGRYSCYSGYYHGHSFYDCARYLMHDRYDVDKLIIGDFCSIGTGVSFIMPGVKVGHGALIGARSVVTKNVEAYTIVAGNPAKPIRKRFSEIHIQRLLEIKWWNWSESQLASSMKLLCSENIDGLYEYWKSMDFKKIEK
jgi:chloramphenicol O-acetyltransferase type B